MCVAGDRTSHSFMSAISSRLIRIGGLFLGLGHGAGRRGAARDPVLLAGDDGFQPGVEASLLIANALGIAANFVQQPAPAQVQANLQILAKMLCGADAGQQLVFLNIAREIRLARNPGSSEFCGTT